MTIEEQIQDARDWARQGPMDDRQPAPPCVDCGSIYKVETVEVDLGYVEADAWGEPLGIATRVVDLCEDCRTPDQAVAA